MSYLAVSLGCRPEGIHVYSPSQLPPLPHYTSRTGKRVNPQQKFAKRRWSESSARSCLFRTSFHKSLNPRQPLSPSGRTSLTGLPGRRCHQALLPDCYNSHLQLVALTKGNLLRPLLVGDLCFPINWECPDDLNDHILGSFSLLPNLFFAYLW